MYSTPHQFRSSVLTYALLWAIVLPILALFLLGFQCKLENAINYTCAMKKHHNYHLHIQKRCASILGKLSSIFTLHLYNRALLFKCFFFQMFLVKLIAFSIFPVWPAGKNVSGSLFSNKNVLVKSRVSPKRA